MSAQPEPARPPTAGDIDTEEIGVEPRDPKKRTEDKVDIGSAEPGMEPG